METPRAAFQARLTLVQQQILVWDAKMARIAWLRLAVFIAAVLFGWQAWSLSSLFWWLGLLAFLLPFAILVRFQAKAEVEGQFLKALRDINQEEIGRLDGEVRSQDGGKEFADSAHPYAADLDLVGDFSLFSLLNRGRSPWGRRALVQWMYGACSGSADSALARRPAVEALSAELAWRQELEAWGRLLKDDGEGVKAFQDWLAEPPLVAGTWRQWLPKIGGPIAFGFLLTWILGWTPWTLLPVLALLNYFLVRNQTKEGLQAYEKVYRRARLLKAYGRMLGHVEAASWRVPGLADDLRIQLSGAARQSRQLDFLVQRLELRLNALPWVVANFLFHWETFWLLRLDQWRIQNANLFLPWLQSLGEMEALSSLSAARYAHPEWVWPEISPQPGFQAEGLGHPLIPAAKRVSNPAKLLGNGQIWLVTGSNMSGKSTFLRTVGINLVLAHMGAPVCATRFHFGPVSLATSMRTADNLEESTSSFFAELKRLQQVVEMAKNHPSTLFLLDEILKGTNSHDRHNGARALIRQLHRLGALGMVSTHDLELADLAKEMPEALTNWNFFCDVDAQDGLFFDYKLRSGVCTSMNASALMRRMGLGEG